MLSRLVQSGGLGTKKLIMKKLIIILLIFAAFQLKAQEILIDTTDVNLIQTDSGIYHIVKVKYIYWYDTVIIQGLYDKSVMDSVSLRCDGIIYQKSYTKRMKAVRRKLRRLRGFLN